MEQVGTPDCMGVRQGVRQLVPDNASHVLGVTSPLHSIESVGVYHPHLSIDKIAHFHH
jgi:hypothetical protein